MKTRIGFVSNSSSSSFLIYGASISRDELIKGLTGANIPFDAEYLQGTTFEGFDFWRPFDDDFYIGRSWSSIDDNETGKQFKEGVEAAIRKILPEAECSTIEQAWDNH